MYSKNNIKAETITWSFDKYFFRLRRFVAVLKTRIMKTGTLNNTKVVQIVQTYENEIESN